MGFYSDICPYFRIRDDKLVEFATAFEALKVKAATMNSSNDIPPWVVEHIETLKIDIHGDLNMEDASGKWYYTDEMAAFLAPFATDGGMDFTGEDGEKWGFQFNGKGDFEAVVWIRVSRSKATAVEKMLKGE
jgi:hypothetical protein